MKKKLLCLGLALTAAVSLGACSNKSKINLQVDNPDEYFITTDIVNVTNQEVFEAMVMAVDNTGINHGINGILELVDKDLLADKFEVNHEEIDNQIQSFKELYEDFDNFLITQGFQNEEDLRSHLELLTLREEAALAVIEISDEEIKEAYDILNGNLEEEEEVPTLEEAWDDVKENLIQAQLTPELVETELARHRQEAGFAILDKTLQEQYITFLESYGVDVDEVFKKTSKTSQTIAATLGENEYTANQLFDRLSLISGLSTGISMVDLMILESFHEVTDEEITQIIDDLKVQWADQFYPIMSQYYGLHDDQMIFDYIKLAQLQNIAFNEAHEVSEATLKELYEAYLAEINARHILVEDKETAEDLIKQLKESDDMETLFKSLAEEHSLDSGSAVEGGDLGAFGKGAMVEEFEEAAFNLEVGTFTEEPVETSYGYHIIYRYEVEKSSFEDIRETLKDQELANLYTQERLEAMLFNYREKVNFKFTNETLQHHYEVIIQNILATLEEQQDSEE